MKKAVMWLLAVLIGLCGGLPACGPSCSDACQKAAACGLLLDKTQSWCMEGCEYWTDCITDCSTDLSCAEWAACRAQACVIDIFNL